MAIRTADIYDCEKIAEFGNELITKSKYGPVLFKDFKLVAAHIPMCVNLTNTRMIGKDDEVIGFVTYEATPWLNITLGKLVYVYIKPEYRGQGFMKEVKEDFEIWAKLNNCNFIILGITTGAAPSDYEKYEVLYMKEVK